MKAILKIALSVHLFEIIFSINYKNKCAHIQEIDVIKNEIEKKNTIKSYF